MSDLSTATGSMNDFNSENALFGELSQDVGLPEVKILGMDLLLQDGISFFEDDSYLDFSEDIVMNNLGNVRESLESTRLTGFEIRDPAPRRQNAPRRARVHFLCDEVDSLILARETLPHIAREVEQDRKRHLEHLFQQGKGLMGERDSLILDRRRLPHLLTHVHDTHDADVVFSWKRNPTNFLTPNDYEVPLNDLKNREVQDAIVPAAPHSTRRLTSTGFGLRMTSPGACAA
jgi:hypothetical protein